MEKPKDNLMGVLLETEMAKAQAFGEEETAKARRTYLKAVYDPKRHSMSDLMEIAIHAEVAKARAFDEMISSRYRLVKHVAVATVLGALSVFFWVLSKG